MQNYVILTGISEQPDLRKAILKSELKKTAEWIFFHYRVDVHTHFQHTFIFKQLVKWMLHPMTPSMFNISFYYYILFIFCAHNCNVFFFFFIHLLFIKTPKVMQVIFLGFLTFIRQDSRTKAGKSERVRRGAGLGRDLKRHSNWDHPGCNYTICWSSAHKVIALILLDSFVWGTDPDVSWYSQIIKWAVEELKWNQWTNHYFELVLFG